MTPRRPRLIAIATATTAALLAGCGTIGGAVSTAKTKPPIVFGISLSLSGAFAGDGQAFQRGYRLWQSDVNEHGGLLGGRPVKLIILNDNSDPKKVAVNYRTLITADHVDMTLGPFSSLLTIPADQAVAKYGYALIEGAGAANTVFDSKTNLKYHNIFSPSLPVKLYMKPFVQWIKSLPASQRPKTASYPTVDDPFATPAVQTAQKDLEALGIRTLYSDKPFKEVPSAYQAPAQAVATANAQIVVLGATDVPTVATFMKAFEAAHYNPKIFIAVSGPDQGQTFEGTVGKANADGMMVPDGWYGAYSNALSSAMVEEYIARYGGLASAINADVAEAFSVGEVAADAITKTSGTDNAKIMRYLHGPVTVQTVQGPARFDNLGENESPESAAFISQWQSGSYVQVLPAGFAGSTQIQYPKHPWGS
jgi:branched-chain amino acid transport system substrate-binding protein